MAGEAEQGPGYKSPTEVAFDNLADNIGFGPAKLAKQLYSQLAPSGGGSSGKFEFSIDEMQQLHKEFESERDAFREIRKKNDRNARQLQQMADDPASIMHYKAAKEHYEGTFAKAILEQFKYCHAYCEAIKLAIDEKELGEEAAIEQMRKREGAT